MGRRRLTDEEILQRAEEHRQIMKVKSALLRQQNPQLHAERVKRSQAKKKEEYKEKQRIASQAHRDKQKALLLMQELPSC